MAVLTGGLADTRSAIMPKSSGGYPSAGVVVANALPVANLSASERWRSLGGSEGAPRQLEDGCRWVGGCEKNEIDSKLIQQCTENSEAGKVTDLNFHFKFVQEIGGLDNFASNLRSLDLSTNNIRIMEGLGGMPKLRELKLYSCQLSRIQNLGECVGLMSLHLEDNHIGAIEGLDTLRGLEYLNMSSNRVQKIGNGLARLTKLRELHLSRNLLSSLDGLGSLVALETCSLDNNKLCQITAEQVKGLGKLDEFRIAGNQLQSLSFLAAGATKTQPSLPSLSQLDASCNRLSAASLRHLPPLSQLGELNLSGNQIEEIEPCFVSACPTLEILDLGGNLLRRGVEDLANLKEIASLRELLIQGNPFISQAEPEIVQKALTDLSCLDYLDDKPIEKVDPLKALEEGGEDTTTFPLTNTNVQQEMKPRPGSAIGSRPGTANSQRPGTAQKMTEAGVKDPLMHTKPKLSDKRYANEEQVVQWERQTLSGLAAVQKQLNKTCFHIDADLEDMSKFLSKADRVLEREKELCAQRPMSPDAVAGSGLPTLRSATVDRANAALAEDAENLQPSRESRVKFPEGRRCRGLRQEVEKGRGGAEDGDDDESFLEDAPSPMVSPSRLTAAAAAAAACDEEISEDEPVMEASPACSSPEPAEEVDEELLHGDASEAGGAQSLSFLGPRAARAAAAAAAVVAAGAPVDARSPGGHEPPALRVDARAKDRGAPRTVKPVLAGSGRPGSQGRPSSRGSQGSQRGSQARGSQPTQGQRVRPPAVPNASGRT